MLEFWDWGILELRNAGIEGFWNLGIWELRDLIPEFGRRYGKLLPRYAGPLAQLLLTHPHSSRKEILELIEQTWNIRVSRQALYHFLKKYGLDSKSLSEAKPRTPPHPATDEQSLVKLLQDPPAPGLPVPQVPDGFFLERRNTPGSFCCFPRFSAGGKSPSNASPTSTARCSVDS